MQKQLPEEVIKRYLLEQVGYEEGSYHRMIAHKEIQTEKSFQNLMYGKLLEGTLTINEKNLQKWYKNLCENRITLVKYLRGLGYLQGEQEIYELTESVDIPGTNLCQLNVHKIIDMAGKPVMLQKAVGPINGCLFANGMYQTEEEYIKNILQDDISSFLIGYCGNLSSEYTQRVIQYYHKLVTKLMKQGVNPGDIQEIEVPVKKESDDRIFENPKKVYVLSYHNQPMQRETASNVVSSTCSQR